MSDTLTIDQINKIRDDKIVCGYVRSNFVNNNVHIPQDIIQLLLSFYHIIIKEVFKHFRSDHYEVTNDGMTVTRIFIFNSLCYGSICIPSTVKRIYSWKFKIVKNAQFMAIGIDETKYIRKEEGGFNDKTGKSYAYGLWNDGDKNQWNRGLIIKRGDDSPQFNTNDTVCMILDLSSRTLSYQINDNEKFVVFTNIKVDNDIEYCMAIGIQQIDDSIQLLSCNVSLNC